MLVIVAKRIAVASLVGPSQAAIERRMPGGQLALDRVAGHHRIVHQQAERDDQRRDRDLLQIDAEHVHHAERHRQRDRDRQRHQQRRTPFPEADQRDEHHQDDRFVEAAHEEIDVLLDLQRLVGSARDDQVVGQLLLELRERGVDGLAEFADLLAGAHLHGQCDGAAAPPLAVGVARV